MKKNVKYIGSAVAVALLAAGAPVVVPMVIPDSNITVSADGIDYNPPADLPITKFVSDFMNQFEDQYVSNDDVFVAALDQKIGYYKSTGLLYSYFDPDNPAHMRDLQNDPAVDYLKSSLPDKQDNDPLQNGNNYYYRDVLGSLTLTDGNGQRIVLNTIDDYNTVVDKFKSNKIVFPITVYIHLVPSTKPQDGYGTYDPASLSTPGITKDMLEKTVTVSMSKFDVTEDTTTPNATVGTKLSDISSTDNKNTFNITDRYADTNKDGARTPIYGQSLFTGDSAGRTAALAYAKTATFDPTSTTSGNVSSGTLDSDGKILKTGKYYQTITYKLANDTDKAIDAMLAGTEDDSTKQKVSPYSVFINGSSTAATDGTDYAYNKDTGTITVLRPINVMDIIKPSLETPNPSSSVGELASSLKDTTGDKLVDDNGQTVPTSDINIDDTYYTDKTVNNPATGLVGSDGTFTKAGTYWRKITFTLSDGDASSITDNGGAINATGKQLTYVQEVDIKDSAKLTVADATANAGDPTSVASATTGNDVTGKDGSLLNQDEGDYKGVSFGTDYYDVNSDNVSKSTVLNGTAGEPTSDVVTDGKFTKAGTYLRTITFYLTQGAISNNAFSGLDPDVKESERNSTVTYVQTITISPNDVTPTISDVHTKIGTSVTDSGLHDPSTVELPNGDDSLLDKTKGDNNSGISFGNVYYDDSTLNNTTNDISTTNKLTTAKTYHRLVTFYLTDTAYNQSQFKGSYTHSDQDKSVSYVQDVIVDPSTKTATFGNHDLEVSYNTATNSSTLTGTSDYTLADDDGSTGSIEDSGASLDGKYYASEADAKTGTNALTVANLTDSTYYRVITIKVKSGDGYLYSYPGASSVDAENDEVQYIQKISVDKEIATVNVSSGNIVSGNTLSKIESGTNEITDSSGKTISTGVVGTNYYDNMTDAINNSSDTSSRIITDGTNKRVTGPEGPIYRTITFTLNSGSNYTLQFADSSLKEGTDYKIDGDTITYVQPINITVANVSEVTIKAKAVNTGTKPADIKTKLNFLSGPADIAIKYQPKGSIPTTLDDVTGTLQFGTTYYDKDAYDKGDKKVVDVLDADGNFNKAGSFYRAVTIPLKNNYASSYNFNVNNQYVSVDTAKDTVTYLQEVDVVAQQGKGDAPDKHTYTGVPITDLNTASDYTLTNNDGTVNLSSGVTFGTNYYPTAQDAVDGTNEIANADTNGDFDDAGDYYRTVTFTVNPDDAGKYEFTDEFNGVKPVVTTANDVTTVTYVQHIHVDKNVATATIAHEKVVADSNIADVPQPDPTVNTLLDKNIQADTQKGHTVVTNDGKDVTADNSQYYDSNDPESYNPDNTSKYVVNGKFTKATTYYRRITFNLISGVSAADDFGGNDVVLVSKTDNSVTYLQAVDVEFNKAVANIVGTSATVGQSVTDPSLSTNETSDIKNSVGSIVSSISYGDSYYKNATDFMKGVAPLGKTFASVGDVYRVITFKLNANALDGNTLDDTVHTTTKNSDGTVSVSYAQKVTVAPASSKANIAGTTTTISNIMAGSSVKDEQGKESNDVSGITSDGTPGSLKDGDVQFGTEYYDTTDSNNTFTDVLDGASTIKATDGVVSGDKYVKPGTYYRTVTVPLQKDASLANSFDPDTAKLSSDGKSVTYVQTITIEQGKSTPNIAGTTTTISNIMAGSSVKDEQGKESNDVSGITSNGTPGSLKDGDVQFGTEYYDTTDSNNIFTDVLNGASTIKATDGVVSGDKYVKPGTYYRTVTVPLQEDASLANSFDPDTAKLSSDGKSVTYVQTITIEQGKSTPNIAGTTTTISDINAGSSVKDEQGKESNDVSGITANGTQGSLKAGDVQFGTDYYDTTDSNNTFTDVLNGSSTIKATDGVVSGDKYVKPGTYYRTVTVPLQKDASLANSFDPDTAKLSSDGKSVTYVQTITIGQGTSTSSIVGTAAAVINVAADSDVGTEQSAEDNTVTGITSDCKTGSLIDGDIQFGTNYYDTTDSNNTFTDVLNGASTIKATDGVVSGGKYVKPGTYYRTVTVPLQEGASIANSFDPDTAKLSSDGKSVTFVQTITVGKNSLDNGNVVIKNLNVKVDGDPTLLTSPAGYKLTDKAGNNLIDTTKPNNGVSFSSDYIDTTTGKTADAAVASGAKITKAGTYTRQVIFNVTDDAIKNNDFTAIGGKLDPETKTVTFTQTVVASANPAASVVTNPSVSSGTNADSETLKNPKDVSITDGAGNSIVSGNPTFGGIFKTPEGAENNTPAGGDATGNLPARTYYQKVTVPLEDNADNAYDFGTDATVDKTNNTVSYIRTITVNPSTGGGGSSNEDDEWTYYKNPGVVTTKTDQNYYYMNHKDNSTVANRTLVKDSSWITDQYRTNRAGVKQYRVATDEWVDSRYVYFLDKSTDNNNTDDDEWTYFKAPGIVTTKTDQNYYYMNHKDDSAVENRTLAKDSSWLTDQYRTNREGVKQYRVATDEWVDSNSVIFTQNVITGISSIKGVVNLDSTNAYYMLYTKEGNVVGNRALKEKSSWLVDEVGRDAQGNVYYRVASNEWVKVVPGVYFDSKAWY